MPVDLFQSLTNPITKETFRTLSASAEAYVFEWIVAPGGYVPFAHTHLVQDEIFRIEAGEVKLLIDGKEFIGKAGDVITVPKGKRQADTLDAALDVALAEKLGPDAAYGEDFAREILAVASPELRGNIASAEGDHVNAIV